MKPFRFVFFALLLLSGACVETEDLDDPEEEIELEEEEKECGGGSPCRIDFTASDETYPLQGKWSFLSYKELGSETYMDNWTCVAQIAHFAYHDENLPLILDLTERESDLGEACTSLNRFDLSLFLSELTACYQVLNGEEIEFVLNPEDAVYQEGGCFMSQCGYDAHFHENLQLVHRYEINGNQLRLFPKGKDYTLWFVAVDEEDA